MKTRRAQFAGSWYPASKKECEKQIQEFLGEFSPVVKNPEKLSGGIVPHAGWYYSGSIACNVINCLQTGDEPDIIVIFGMHLHMSSSGYIMTKGDWETPFGEITIENDLAEDLAQRFHLKIETADKYTQDNTIELQLPFVKYFFPNATLVPVGVPPNDTSFEIGKYVAEKSTQMGKAIKVLGSTDLTHYGSNYGFSPQGKGPSSHDWVRQENDQKVIQAMMAMDPKEVLRQAKENNNACCSGAAAAAIATGKQLGAEQAEKIAYQTSYEKSPGESFVGYVGIVF